MQTYKKRYFKTSVMYKILLTKCMHNQLLLLIKNNNYLVSIVILANFPTVFLTVRNQ